MIDSPASLARRFLGRCSFAAGFNRPTASSEHAIGFSSTSPSPPATSQLAGQRTIAWFPISSSQSREGQGAIAWFPISSPQSCEGHGALVISASPWRSSQEEAARSRSVQVPGAKQAAKAKNKVARQTDRTPSLHHLMSCCREMMRKNGGSLCREAPWNLHHILALSVR